MAKQEDRKPWYKQFWPWVLICLPLGSVISALLTVNIAIRGADDMVVDNYYKEGKAINQRLDQDVKASELGMGAALSFNFAGSELKVSLEGDIQPPEVLELKLLHPIEANLDKRLELELVGPGYYRTALDEKLEYSYHLQLLPVENPEWRLTGQIDFNYTSEATLIAQ